MKKFIGVLISGIMAMQSMAVVAETYYKTEEQTHIADGVVHKYIESYTHAGWQNIHVVEADLTVPHVSADVITHPDGLGYAANVLKLAQNENAVAAINGDFFARNAWDKASTIGLLVRDGKLISTQSAEVNGAAIGFAENGSVLLEYIKTDVVFTAANGNSIKIKEINKYDSLKEPVIYTSAFSEVTGGSYDNILEVVVVDNVVTEMRRNMDGVTVPENGYVIRHLPEFDTFLWENVQVGDAVTLTVNTSLDIESLKSASAGGTLLVKNGEKHTLTHSISGTNPRTMLGINQEGTKLYLITADGRSGNAAGLTMQGMQDLALELGLYTAINLDGGGSTTMVTRNPKTDALEVNNTPSDGSLRTVPVAIGIFSDAPEGEPKTLVLAGETRFMFPGTSRTFAIAYALDENGNPCYIPNGEANWETDNGSIKNGVFTAGRPGKAEISVSIGNAVGSLTVEIAESPVKLYTKPQSVSEGESFAVFGADSKGNIAQIDLEDCVVKERNGYRLLSFGGAEGALYVTTENTDTFESENGVVNVYPSNTEGSYSLTEERAISGTRSGRLNFAFTRGTDTQAVYLLFTQAKPVPSDAKYMGVFVYAPYENYQWLRVQGENEKGEAVRVTLSDSMEFNGWKYLSAEIPDSLKKVTGLYVVQNGKKVAAESYILLDDFAFSAEEMYYPMHQTAIPEQTVEGEYKITVTGESLERNTLYAGLYDATLKGRLETADADESIALNRKVGAEKGTEAFYAFSYGNTAGLVLAANQSGVSGADNSQWSKIRSYAEKHDNLLLFMQENPAHLPNRQDEVLFNLIREAGCENVYVFCPGTVNGISVQEGVHYVTVSGLKYAVGSVLLDQMQYMRFAEVVLKDGQVHINFRKVYE